MAAKVTPVRRNMDIQWTQVVTQSFTCGVKTEDDIITETAPILKKFKGQPFSNLINWLSNKIGTYKLLPLDPPPDKKE